ncbi:MAG: hypothetical protein V3S56_09590 [Gemmatimonadota bacterium]
MPIPFFLIAAAIAAAGAIQQGQAARKAADAQSEIFRRQAERERLLSEQEAISFSRSTSRLAATQRALQGGSGAVAGVGTFAGLSDDFAAEAEFQRLNILSGGEATASRLEASASLERFKGKQAQKAGFFRAGSSLISGAGQQFGQ